MKASYSVHDSSTSSDKNSLQITITKLQLLEIKQNYTTYSHNI